MWIFVVIGLILIGIGLSVHVFKWYFLIAGYNTMPEEKRKKVNTEGLGRLLGIYCYVNGGMFILAGVLQTLGIKQVLVPTIIFFCIATIFILVKAQKFDGNIYNTDGKLLKGAWKQLVIPLGIVFVAVIFVCVLMFYSTQSTKVTILDEGIQIHGMYGEVYNWTSINTVKLIEEIPTIEKRTNGSAVGSNLKGYFKTKEFGIVKLFVNVNTAPFVYIETTDGISIFNLKDAHQTQNVYSEIVKRLS
ncbi:MAG: DUF3784 domain-containing protein [Dehalococcoidales bacterium]